MLVVMLSDRSVVRKHCCLVILFSVVFLFLFYVLWSEINVDDDNRHGTAMLLWFGIKRSKKYWQTVYGLL